MKIDILDRSTVLVTLGSGDMRDYALDLSSDNAGNEEGLLRLLYRVGEVIGPRRGGRSYLIEALPSRDGCLLIISVHPAERRRLYRVKRGASRTVCVFFDADAMLDFMRDNGGGGFSLYLYKGRYVLLPSASASVSAESRLVEYGEVYHIGASAEARVREFGKLLRESVQRRHIRGRAVAVRDAAPGDSRG